VQLETMSYSVEGRLARLTFSRPDVHNAMNLPWPEDFLRAAKALDREPGVEVVIVSGAGRSFSSGIDLKVLERGEFPMGWFRSFERGLRALEQMKKVVIAAIHGYCIGGGLQVALACDVRVAAEKSQMGLTAVKESLVPGLGTFRLARFIGLGRAKRLILSAELISASDAQAMGLVDYVVPEAEFEARLDEITQLYLRAVSEGQRQSKQLIQQSFDLPWDAFLEKYLAAQQRALETGPGHRDARASRRK
jgi:enoyl-CoA hydratase